MNSKWNLSVIDTPEDEVERRLNRIERKLDKILSTLSSFEKAIHDSSIEIRLNAIEENVLQLSSELARYTEN